LTEGGKQIILQKQGGIGTPGQPQIVTLVKTSQGMQVEKQSLFFVTDLAK
jgi:hypothetical protein